jgi:hypothetical protein
MVEVAEVKEVAAAPVAPLKSSSIIDVFGLEKLLSAGLKTELFVMESQIRVKHPHNDGWVYELSCKIFSDIGVQGRKIPEGLTYKAIRDFYSA